MLTHFALEHLGKARVLASRAQEVTAGLWERFQESSRRTPEPHCPDVNTRPSAPSVVQEVCVADAGQT